ncbi:MAG: right-handed parallel beta-helix repeat-containing protein [Phycisphaeraceae bacterium]|nr:right-handed parallel beta-helix repeat-containing protein [Phycisphaeraceae bacterium]
MRLRHLFSGRRNLVGTASSPNLPPSNPRFPGLELLEPRLLLSGTAYVIDSLLDTVAADGHLTLREAIEAANTNAAVNEAAAGSASETDSITFAPSLFAGGHADLILSGTELSITDDLSITGPEQELLSIDANQLSRVFGISGSETNVTMEGLTITGGYANIDGGGGFRVDQAAVTLTDCAISGNSAASYGGGVYVKHGSLTLETCAISGNSAGQYGGGVYVIGTVTLANCTVSENTVSQQYGNGGGLYVFGTATLTSCTISGNASIGEYGTGGGLKVSGTATLIDCVISDNTADSSGGGLFGSSTVELTNCTVIRNAVTGSYGTGGGLLVRGTATLNHCVISENTAPVQGGGLSVYGTATLSYCTISGNSAVMGGGVYLDSLNGNSTLTNCAISGNTATSASGGLYGIGTVTLTNCTISGNWAQGFGGGLGVDGTTTLNNTIVAVNAASTDADIHGGPYTASSSFLGGDPKFIRNPSAGLDGIWGTPDDDLGDLHLRADSPCVNAGDNSLAVDADGDPLTIDLDSHPRLAGTQVDIGAYELGGIPGDFTGDWQLTLSDINHFKLVLTDTPAWQAQYPGVPLWAIDPNGDGSITLSDINAFKTLLTGSAATSQSLNVAPQDVASGINEPRASASGASISSTPLRSWLVEAQSPPPSADSSWRSAQPTKKSLFAHRRSIFGDVAASTAQPPAPIEAGVLADLPAVAVA